MLLWFADLMNVTEEVTIPRVASSDCPLGSLGINFSSPQPSAANKIKDGGHSIRYAIT